MKLVRIVFAAPLCLAIFLAQNTHAAEQKLWEPSVCVGLRSNTGAAPTWGMVGIGEQFERGQCPKGFAFVGAEPTGGRYSLAERVPVTGNCCELPPDALTAETVYALASCPEGYVATGARALPSPQLDWWSRPKAIDCTKINTARYMLGETQLAVRVTPARELADIPFLRQIIGEYSQFNTSSGRIPAGIRYAIGRLGRRRWSADTCTGYPWGSLLVSKAPRGCNFTFRQLQYRGLTNDPPRGTPVKLYPDCDYVEDPLSATPKCIPPPGPNG